MIDIDDIMTEIEVFAEARLPKGKHEFALIRRRQAVGGGWLALFGGAGYRSPTTTGEGIFEGQGREPSDAIRSLWEAMRNDQREQWWLDHVASVAEEKRSRAEPLPLDAKFLFVPSNLGPKITASHIFSKPLEKQAITADKLSKEFEDGVIAAGAIKAERVYMAPPPGWPQVRTYPPLPDGHDDLF